jgi:hypothetical protein
MEKSAASGPLIAALTAMESVESFTLSSDMLADDPTATAPKSNAFASAEVLPNNQTTIANVMIRDNISASLS